MDVKDIIIEKLKKLGADGLCCEDCGCGIDDLCPCGEDCLDCEPAKRRLDLYDKQTDIYNPLNEQIKVKNRDGETKEFICKIEDRNMKFRKKPVDVDAIQYTGSLENVSDLKTLYKGINMSFENDAEIITTHILTLSGVMEVNKGDWIIKGSDAKGGFQFWPVTPEYFAENYEKVMDDEIQT